MLGTLEPPSTNKRRSPDMLASAIAPTANSSQVFENLDTSWSMKSDVTYWVHPGLRFGSCVGLALGSFWTALNPKP